MPVDWKRYPKNWKEISVKIRERSKGQCECMGECGLHKTTGGARRCCERNGEKAKWAKGKVILTVAHLGVRGDKHDKMDCADDNLKAMCQRCHLRFDIKEHVENRIRNKDKKRGQLQLL